MPHVPYIHSVEVEGLHDQFDFELKLLPGLNVLYGKNGRGKTTFLHLLANLLELDFSRFAHLQFYRISVVTSDLDQIDLIKDKENAVPRVILNDSEMSFSAATPVLSESEQAELRNALGPKPTYLPAFRSILERTRLDAYYRGERREPEFEAIMSAEIESIKLAQNQAPAVASLNPRQLQDEGAAVAEKTILCRQWFGRFVPVVRYPSVTDVEDFLTQEWRRASIEISGREQRMFEETFVRIFRVVAGVERTPTMETNEDLLASISTLLTEQGASPTTHAESKEVFGRLVIAAESLESRNLSLGGLDSSLLEIYRQLLVDRNHHRQLAFQKSREFEASINRFLDRKTLKIGSGIARPGPRSTSVVSVTTMDSGSSYGLSALSSGERQILTMLHSASRNRFSSGAFLIDEPELSLHIDWQRIILRELQRQAPDRQLIACTHSPEVGADYLSECQDFEPRSTKRRQGTLFTDEEL